MSSQACLLPPGDSAVTVIVTVRLGQEYQRRDVPAGDLGRWRPWVCSQGAVTCDARGRWCLLAFSALELPFFPFK